MTSLERIGGHQVVINGSLRAMAKAAKSRPVLLLDCSGSMADSCHAYGADVPFERKIDALRRIVGNLRGQASFEQLIFESRSSWEESIPEPAGSTCLGEALDRIAAERPTTRRVVLITDGWPDDRMSAIRAAKGLGCALDIFYVGPANDTAAQAFLEELAEACGGKFGACDLGTMQDALENKVRLALTSGQPELVEPKGPIAL